MHKNRLIAIFVAIFVVIAVPIAGLLYDSYLHMQDDTKAEWAMHANQVLKMANNRIKDDLSIENKRSFMEYRFIKVAKTISAGEQPTYSDLALNYPVVSCDNDSTKNDYCSQYTGLIGHFQIDPDGVFSTPYLPAGVLGQVQLENREVRESLQNKLKFIVRDMGIKNKKATAQDSLKNSSALDQLANEVDLSKRKKGRKMRVERTSEQEQFAFNVESAKRDTSGLYRIFPYVGTMDISIESFQVELDSRHIVFYRNVLRGEENFVQGFVVDIREYLKSIVSLEISEYENSDNHLSLRFFKKGEQVISFGDRNNKTLKVFEEPLAEPLDGITLAMYIDQDAEKSSDHGQVISNGNLLILIGGIMFLLLGGGLVSIYRLTQSQLNLAQKRQDFISAGSHELKTPLTSIKMYAELLQNSWVANEEKRHKYYNLIASEAERLTRLIQNVLNLSKLDGNRWTVQLRQDRPKAVLDDFVATYTRNVEKNGFSLTVTCDTSASEVSLMMDRDAVMQILMNLVDNSLKFSKNADYKMIVIELKKEGNHVYLAVRDYGPGIPPSEMKKVFQEFYRVENEMTRETKGTGIGLSMVKKLCALSGMTIELENAGPGLRTKIHFPPASV